MDESLIAEAQNFHTGSRILSGPLSFAGHPDCQGTPETYTGPYVNPWYYRRESYQGYGQWTLDTPYIHPGNNYIEPWYKFHQTLNMWKDVLFNLNQMQNILFRM